VIKQAVVWGSASPYDKAGFGAAVCSSVSIVTRLRPGLQGGLGFDPCLEQISFPSAKCSDRLLGPTQPHIEWILGIKRPGREADHSTPPIAEVKNGGAIPLLPHMPPLRGA
jgi:hypothetical protein